MAEQGRDTKKIFERLVGKASHYTIHELNQLPDEAKAQIYSLLIPDRVFQLFDIDRKSFKNRHGEYTLRLIADRSCTFVIIELYEHPGERDPIFSLEIEDTAFSKIDINFLIINDVRGPRFDTDIDQAGRRTKFATVSRNIPEEIRAMEFGLTPGQVRPGLRLFKDFVPLASAFIEAMGQDMVIAEPLAYNNAIIFESYGFGYVRGQRKMEEINQGFQPGGELYERLDGSTPFRRRGMEKTVRGRSWAIHDGILGEPWRGIEMYRPLRGCNVNTFPGWVY
jgi:hypothetical protein